MVLERRPGMWERYAGAGLFRRRIPYIKQEEGVTLKAIHSH